MEKSLQHFIGHNYKHILLACKENLETLQKNTHFTVKKLRLYMARALKLTAVYLHNDFDANIMHRMWITIPIPSQPRKKDRSKGEKMESLSA